MDQDAGGEDADYKEVIIVMGDLPIGEPLDSPEEGNYKMGHPNTCILLCDYQLGMTINSELDEEGEAVFKNQDGEEITGSAVTCWEKLKH